MQCISELSYTELLHTALKIMLDVVRYRSVSDQLDINPGIVHQALHPGSLRIHDAWWRQAQVLCLGSEQPVDVTDWSSPLCSVYNTALMQCYTVSIIITRKKRHHSLGLQIALLLSAKIKRYIRAYMTMNFNTHAQNNVQVMRRINSWLLQLIFVSPARPSCYSP